MAASDTTGVTSTSYATPSVDVPPAALRRGALFLKYCRHGKPHACFVELLASGRELQWVSAGGKSRVLSLAAVKELVAGQQTAVFRRQPGVYPPSVSFSVVYRQDGAERTLDLVCKDNTQFDLWVPALRAAVARCATGVVAPQDTALQDDVLFWGHHAASTVTTSLGPPKRERATPLAAGDGYDAWHSKSLAPTHFARAEALNGAILSFGQYHGALLNSTGEVYTWGAANAGDLGHGGRSYNSTLKRVEVLRGTRVRQVACGSSCTAAVTEDSELFMWGYSMVGKQQMPKVICGPRTGVLVRSVSCGPYHTSILSIDGALYTMGEGVFGALGHGDDRSRATPARVDSLSNTHVVSHVACGVWHTAALARSKGASDSAAAELFTWGQGDRGQLGDGVKGGFKMTPYRVDSGQQPTPPVLTHVVCGAAHTAVLTAAGAVLVAGKDCSGPSSPTFRRVLGPLADVRVDQIACGDKHTCVLSSAARKVFTWGTGAGGRLGHGGERDEAAPRAVDSLRGRDVRLVFCGPECTVAVCRPQQLTEDEKAALAKAQDSAGWVVDTADIEAASNSRSEAKSASTSEMGRALKTAKIWQLASLKLGRESNQMAANPAAVVALQLELESARAESQMLRAQLAAANQAVAGNGHAAPQPAHHDASTMTDPAQHVQINDGLQPSAGVDAAPSTAALRSPAGTEEVHITVGPGVHIVAIGRVVRRVRFDKRVYTDDAAVDWWEQRRGDILREHKLSMP